MSDNQSRPGTLLEMVKELRGLLLDFIAGGPTKSPRYKVLRDSLMADPLLSKRVPALVLDYENLNDLWQFLKDVSPSKVERQELIRKQFDDLASELSGASADVPGHREAITQEKLFKGWFRLSQHYRLVQSQITLAVQGLVDSLLKDCV